MGFISFEVLSRILCDIELRSQLITDSTSYSGIQFGLKKYMTLNDLELK